MTESAFALREILKNWDRPAPTTDKRWLCRQIEQLAPGQHITIDFHALGGWRPEELMQSTIGSAYRILSRVDERTRSVTFWRLEEDLTDGRKTYVDEDRRHLYDFDGQYYHPKPEEA